MTRMPNTQSPAAQNGDTVGAWSHAVTALAKRVSRRRRLSDASKRMAWGLFVGTVMAVLLRLMGHSTPWVAATLGICTLIGLLWPWKRPTPDANVGAAAWALDRVGGHKERALTVALNGNALHRNVADALPTPPHIRLRPAEGTAPFMGVALLAGAVLLAPSASSTAVATGRDSHAGDVTHAGTATTESTARDPHTDTMKKTLAAIRRAAGIHDEKPLTRDELKQRLARPETKRAVQDVLANMHNEPSTRKQVNPSGDAAMPTRRTADAHADRPGPEADEDTLAAWLTQEDRAWRRALGDRRRARVHTQRIPPTRRGVVARYLSKQRTSHPTSDEGPNGDASR